MNSPQQNLNLSPRRRARRIYRVTFVGLAVNVVLTAGKLAAGITGRSSAMVADAIHSASDLASDLVVLLFVRLAGRPHDATHKYGHGKFETLASVVIALVLGAVGVGILWKAVQDVRYVWAGGLLPRPGAIAFWAAILSIAIKEALYRYTVREGHRIASPTLVANAWHHRSDALSSVGTLIGIGCARFLGEAWRVMDPVAAIVVALLILRIAWRLSRSGIDELLERALPPETEAEIVRLAAADPRVADVHNLRTRRIGPAVAIEMHIRLPGTMTVRESHSITVELERRLRHHYGPGTLISVHVEPTVK